MKYLVTHRNDILKAISDSSLSVESFSFRKKRGRIHVYHDSSGKYFSYIRKIAMNIDNKKQWEKITKYEISHIEKQVAIVNTWDDVHSAFTMWLKTL